MIDRKSITFDLMKEIPKSLRDTFSSQWRNMDISYIKKFLEEWKALPRKSIVINLNKNDYDELIVKDLYGRDIFSFIIDEDLSINISQYQGFWNITYSDYNEKIIIFTG